MRKTFGLCLGAGGSRGVAHVGFLQALEEEGLQPDCIAGCSMGAVVGAAYAAGMTVQNIRDAVFGLKMGDIVSPDLRLVKNNGFFKTEKMKNLLVGYFGNIGFADLKIPFCCVATDMTTGGQRVFREGFVADAVIASSCIPAVFQPRLAADGAYLIDGGVLDRVPVAALKSLGADVCVAVDVLATLKPVPEVPKNVVDLLMRMIGILDIERTKTLKKEREDFIDCWIEPDLGDMNQYLLKDVPFAYDKGYESGKAHAEKIRKLLKRERSK